MCVGFTYWQLECANAKQASRTPGGGSTLTRSSEKGQGFPTVTCKGRDTLPCLKVQTLAPVDFLFAQLVIILYTERAIFTTLFKLIFTWWEDTPFSLHSCEFKRKSEKIHFLFQALTKGSIFPGFAYRPPCSIFFFKDPWYTQVISIQTIHQNKSRAGKGWPFCLPV